MPKPLPGSETSRPRENELPVLVNWAFRKARYRATLFFAASACSIQREVSSNPNSGTVVTPHEPTAQEIAMKDRNAKMPKPRRKSVVRCDVDDHQKSSSESPPERPTTRVAFNLGDIKAVTIQPGLYGWVIPQPPRPPRLDVTITVEFYTSG